MDSHVENGGGAYNFAGFEIAQTVAPEINHAVTTACMRSAATRFGHLFFGELTEQDEFPAEVGQVQREVRRDKRWSGIIEALKMVDKPLVLLNEFAAEEVQARVCLSQGLSHHDEIPGAYVCPGELPQDQEAQSFRVAASAVEEGDTGGVSARHLRAAVESNPEGSLSLLPCCFLTSSTILAAQALEVAPGDRVLDLCAGPGLKSLVLAGALFAQHKTAAGASLLERAGTEAGVLGAGTGKAPGILVCNEPNKAQRALLDSLLTAVLPADHLRKGGPVVTTSVEASAMVSPVLKRLGPFDKVLVDPPCFAARSAAKKRSKEDFMNLTSKKHSTADPAMEDILRCAGALVRPGGVVVYTTRSLLDSENDLVISSFLRREDGNFVVEPGQDDSPVSGAEQTSLGTIILPDQGTQHGPVFISRLRKL